jgi:hypothetical protein
LSLLFIVTPAVSITVRSARPNTFPS